MNRDEAIEIILMRAGMRQKDTVLQRACVLEMKLAQERMERGMFKPWFMLSENATTNANPGEERIPLPKDFNQEYEEGCLWLRTWNEDEVPPIPQFHEIVKMDYELARARYTVPGKPKAYAIVNNYFTLHPLPDAPYLLQMRYYRKAAVISEDYGSPGTVTTNEWLTYAADWLIGEVGAVICGSYIKDPQTAAEFKAQADRGRNEVYVDHVAREEANRSRIMGDDGD